MARQSDARVFSPLSVADAIQSLARNPDALVFAGGTAIFREVPGILLPLNGTIIPIGRIQELKQVNRTERYLDIGACLTAASLFALGPRIAPRILIEAASSIARTPVRCLATVGGNLCVDDRRMDLHAVLSALDAQAEFRGDGQARWLPLPRIALGREDPRPQGPEILTRVRVPLETWNAAIFRKLGLRDFPDTSTYAFVFLARTTRGIISDVRVLLSGKSALRRRDIESGLAGKTLPLDRNDVDGVVDAYRKAASEDVVLPELRIAQFLSLLRSALLSLYI
jgi:CO/xanthine dehydrogenase FAD-binding subunit